MFSKHGEALYKSLLFSAGGLANGDEVDLGRVRWMFQEYFVALLKTPATQEEMEGGHGLHRLTTAGSDEKVQCHIVEMQFHNLQNREFTSKVPANIKDHLANCNRCAVRFALYLKVFRDGLDEQDWWSVEQITTQLYRHFSLMGADVDCATVRAFLPLLVDSERLIAVPTPVTVHPDHCQDCRNDVELLGALELDSQQADRLADLYSQPALEGSDDCENFSESIALIAKICFNKVGAEALEHVRMCKSCRETLRNERAGVVYKVDGSESPDYPCDKVGPGDLFDHCVLFAGMPADDWRVKDCTELTDHVAGCRTCLERMFRMHGTIFGAANRGESGIVTCYDFPSKAKKPGFINVSHLHSRVGMQVSLREGPADKPKATGWPQKIKRLTGGPRPRRLIPAAAAAIILMAIALILFSPVADGRIALGQVYQAIADITSVCISRFVPGKKEPTRIGCVSRGLDLWFEKTEKQAVLFDLRTRTRKIKDLSTNAIKTDAMTEELGAKVENVVAGYFGLMPFPEIKDVPKDAQWHHVSDEDVETVVPGTEIYDLIWPEDGGWLHKWRFFIDARTFLPYKVERYRKLPGEGQYTFQFFALATYISESEIEALIWGTFE
jgi:hypothetical protein